MEQRPRTVIHLEKPNLLCSLFSEKDARTGFGAIDWTQLHLNEQKLEHKAPDTYPDMVHAIWWWCMVHSALLICIRALLVFVSLCSLFIDGICLTSLHIFTSWRQWLVFPITGKQTVRVARVCCRPCCCCCCCYHQWERCWRLCKAWLRFLAPPSLTPFFLFQKRAGRSVHYNE